MTDILPSEAVEMSNHATQLEQGANALQIVTEGDLQVANDMLGYIAKAKKGFEEKRKSLVKPLQDHVSRINGMFREYTDPLERADKTLRGKLLAYRQEQQRIQREEEERLRKLAEKEQKRLAKQAEKNGLPTPPPIVVPMVEQVPKSVQSGMAKTGFRTVWTFEVVDPAKVPDEYKVVDEKKIRAVVNAGIREISGVRIYPTEQVAVKAR